MSAFTENTWDLMSFGAGSCEHYVIAELIYDSGQQAVTFPLGIIEEIAYEETRLKLEPGDKVILFTDGIVEAMNEAEEIFGFDRLLDVVKNSRALTADMLLEEIKHKVNQYAGSAAHHGDITIIVIQAI